MLNVIDPKLYRLTMLFSLIVSTFDHLLTSIVVENSTIPITVTKDPPSESTIPDGV